MSILDSARTKQDDAIANSGIRWTYAEADEQHLLGAIFVDAPRNFQAMDVAMGEVNEGCFGSKGHLHIWRGMVACIKAHGTISVSLVAGWLDRKGKLDSIGGREYLYQLAEIRTNPSEVISYAKEVRAAADARELQRVGWFIAQGNLSRNESIAMMRRALLDASATQELSCMTIAEAIESGREKRIKRREEGLPAYYATGLGGLDNLLDGGLRMGTINFFGGPEKVGKTRFVTALNVQMVGAHNAIVDWWSVEQLYEEIVDFHVANIRGIPTGALRDDRPPVNMTLDEFEADRRQGEDYLVEWSKGDFHLHKPKVLYAEHIYHQAEVRMRQHREEIACGRPYVVIVDYTQSVKIEASNFRERERINEVCEVLRAVAKTLGACVIPVFHTNRGPDSEASAAHDVYGSAQLAKDCDFLGILWRPEREHPTFRFFQRLHAGRNRGPDESYIDFFARLGHCRYEAWDVFKHGDFETYWEDKLEAERALKGGRR